MSFKRSILSLTLAAAALLAAPAANAQNSNDFAALRTQSGVVTLEYSRCVDSGKVLDKLYSARFVADGGRTYFGCYFIDPQLHEAVVTFRNSAGTFTYPMAAFHIYR